MKKRLTALIFAAAMLTGCADSTATTEPQTGSSQQESDATSSTASSTTSEATSASTEKTTTAAPDAPETPTETKLTAEQLFGGRQITGGEGNEYCFNDDNPIINISGDVVTTQPERFHTYQSHGVMSQTNDSAFMDSLDQSAASYDNEFWYSAESFGSYTIDYTVDRITANAVNVAEYTQTLKGNKIYQRNAFIRKSGVDKYEFIIDPRYMYDIPLLSNNADLMKFDVNGTEFYADTLSVSGCKLNMIKELFDTHGVGEEYVYAQVYFKDLDIIFNSESGYANAADVIKIEVLTEDTDSVISGAYQHNAAVSQCLEAACTLYEYIESKKPRINFIDLDFNGTPELIMGYYTEFDGMGDYYYNDIYTLDGGVAQLVGTLRFDLLYTAQYDGKRGWIIPYQQSDIDENGDWTINDTGAMFFTLENGSISEHIFGYARNNIESGMSFFIDGAPVDFTSESYTQAFDGLENTRYFCNGFEGGFEYEAFMKALEAQYDDYITDDGNFMYFGGLYYTGLDAPQAMRPKLAAMLTEFYHAPVEAKMREESMTYFEGAKAKPVIYLYPEETTEVSVSVDFPYGGEFSCTYPDYRDGWSVTAQPDGTLHDADGNEYYCLYWEGEGGPSYDMREGFCVSGRETADFLREKLLYMGLSAREANEFIIYWLPLMEDNRYNVISFHTDAYNDTAPLTVAPAPDSMIRVFMTWYASDSACEIPAQQLPQYQRNGFTVVEWGGSQYGKAE